MDKVGSKKVHPITEKRGYDKYPIYSVVTIEGVEENFEQRQYISDNPK
jgi:hypothetical protein